jgi:hypothetical protein
MEIWQNPVPADVAEWFDQLATEDPPAVPVLTEAADRVRTGHWEAAEARLRAALAGAVRLADAPGDLSARLRALQNRDYGNPGA